MMSTLLLVFVVLCLSLAPSCVASDQTFELRARGATFPAPIFHQWILAYTTLKAGSTKISYIPTGSGDGQRSLRDCNPYCVDFAGSESPLPISDYSNPLHIKKGLQLAPFVAGAVVPVYNIPELAAAKVTDRLIFSRKNLADMFIGNIKFWNDTAFVADQTPAVQAVLANLPNAPITPVIRSDSSGTTTIFTSALSSFSDDFRTRAGTVPSWPKAFTNGTFTRAIPAPGNEGVSTLVQITTYSIGYVAWGFAKDSLLVWGYLVNRNGTKVSAETFEPLQEAMANAVFDNYFSAQLVDLPGTNSFPILGFSYLIIEKNAPNWTTCERRREFWKFVRFVLTNEDMALQALTLGYAPLSPALAARVLALFESVQCEGVGLLEPRADQVRGFDIELGLMIAAAVVILGCGIPVLVLLLNKPQKNTLNLAKQVFVVKSRRAIFFFLFAVSVFVGGLLTLLSVFFWAQIPFGSDSAICAARLWLTFTGLAIVLGAVASRASQMTIVRLLGLKNRTKGSSTVYMTLMFFRDAAILLALEVILLGVWEALDPFKATLFLSDELNLEGEWRCTTSGATFPAIQAALLFVAMIYGLVQVYLNWSFSTRSTGQMWLLIASYNGLVTLIIIIPLLMYIPGDTAQSIVATVAILFYIAQAMLTFLIPGFVNAKSLLGDGDLTNSTTSRRRLSSTGSSGGKPTKSLYDVPETSTASGTQNNNRTTTESSRFGSTGDS